MEWSDEGIVLAVRPLGESSVVLSLLTRGHGRHAGLVRGGAGRRARGILQPGNRLAAGWRGRLPDHLGTLVCELLQPLAPAVLACRARLAAVAAACAVLETALPEREPQPALFDALAGLIAAVERDPAWRIAYVRWEIALLAELGYGLDLSRCAASGATQGLAYVSPRTGRAVSAAAAAPWQDRLLALPAFLVDPAADADAAAIDAGLALSGYFLQRCVYAERGLRLPAARARLPDELARAAADGPPARGEPLRQGA